MHKQKSIWIVNEYAGSPYHGMEFRHYYLGKALVKLGYDVTIISASYSHLFQKLPKVNGKFTFDTIDGVKYLWIKVPQYKSSHHKKRVLKWLSFSFSLFFLPLSKMSKPEVVLLSPMSTFPVYPVYRLAKKMQAKFVFEVKDIWPLSLMELGGYKASHPFIRALSWCERFAWKHADMVVSNLPNYVQHISDSGFKRDVGYIPNGVDLDELSDIQPLAEDIRCRVPDEAFVVGYVGTIGVANALDYLIAAAELLLNNNKIVFVIVGAGQEKTKLEEKGSKLSNVVFVPPIQKKQVQSMLGLFDVCYIGLKKERLFEYGVSPNKIFDYMYARKPILHSISTTKDLVQMAGCGLSIEAENSQAIADGVLEMYAMSPQVRLSLGQAGKEFVLKHHSYDQLALQYRNMIEGNEKNEPK
ncbi:MAG: glycosyltransferase family 4 protein [Mariprofundaceae bacterium]